jgi:hypothetical protein
MPRFNPHNTAVAAIVVAAAAIRLYGIDWGLPHLFEEATPLKQAWEMWGWGSQRNFDLNPHFFNYPSFMLYVHFVGQGLLLLGMKVVGAIDSTFDIRVMYVLERTPLVVVGRVITAAFGVGTVWLAYAVGRRIAGRTVGLLAALFLCINAFHVAKCQVVEVDVPLTFFFLLALWFAVRLAEAPTRRLYILAGVAAGLAMSTKYTAAVLVVPIVVAHLIATRSSSRVSGDTTDPSWRNLLLTGVIAVVAFAVTSPFVLLDFSTFWNHIMLERQHMQLGHFGLDSSQSWWFYTAALTKRLLGWPLAVLSVVGLVQGAIRRRPWAYILGSFVLVYWLIISSWEMKADRYALPLLPPLIVFAAAVVIEVGRGWQWRAEPSWSSRAAAAALVVTAVVPIFAQYPGHFERLKPDTRVAAKEWIEERIPAGSFIVWEYYGPELLQPVDIWSQEPDVRRLLTSGESVRPLYAVQTLPMVQIQPERCGVFYDLSLYGMADFVITTSSVRGRYENDRVRFARQISFYNQLESAYTRLKQFRPNGMTGPTVTIYRNPRHSRPFARRQPVGPADLEPRGREPSGEEGSFYYNLGLSYETFGFPEQAIHSYMRALQFPYIRPARYYDVSLGVVRTFVTTGRVERADRFLEMAVQAAPTPQTAARLQRLRAELPRER